MNTIAISATNAISFFRNLHAAAKAKATKEAEGAVIESFVGYYSVGEPHGLQLDMARHMARVARDPRFAELEIRCGQIVEDLTASERELLRRWRNYERRALIARNNLRDLDAEILEKTEAGDVPSSEECARRSTLVAEVEFWQCRADNPQDYPLEVDQWGPDPEPEETLENLIAAQKTDKREWERRSR